LRYKSRKRLFNLILKRLSQKNWLLLRDTNKQFDQLTHDECEALWAKINFTLQTLN
jgi:hypothetical protein